MSKEFTPDADDQLPEKKSSQQLLLLLLLLLILLFVYLYFFTGLIKPRGEAPKPPTPVEAPVKKPLPPRPEAKGGAAAKPGAPAGAVQEEKAAAPQAKPGAPEAAKQAAAGKQAPAQEAAAAKPAAKAPAANAPAAKPAAPKAAAGKEAAVKPAANGKEAAAKPAGAAKEAGKPAAAAAKPAAPAKGVQPGKEPKAAAVAEKKGAAKPEAKAAAKEGAEKPAAVAAKKVPAVAKTGAYALEINGDLAESEVTSATAKLKQAGIGNVVKSKSQKGEPMHRLFLADFANRDEALEELERLKLAAPDAFMLKENGRYAVYAGSYMREAKAASEQTRLEGKGVQLLPKTATLPVAVYKLRAGSFADQAAADRAAKTLKKYGLTASVVKTAKGK